MGCDVFFFWRAIPQAPAYEVSSQGHVRRNGVVLTPDVDKRGRRWFTFSVGGLVFKVRASRLVLSAFVGVCPPGMEACHENGDEADDRLENLRWDTHNLQ